MLGDSYFKSQKGGGGGVQGIPCPEGNCSVLVIYKRSLVGTINVREIFSALF